MFSGFISLWTIPLLLRCITAYRSWTNNKAASSSYKFPFLLIKWKSSSPYTNLVTSKKLSGVVMSCKSFNKLGWSTLLRIAIYFYILMTSFFVTILLLLSILTATDFPVGMWTALLTLPKVPLPIVLSSLRLWIFSIENAIL